MKNKFSNKTVGTIIIAGMLCAMLTAGCAKADSNADVNSSASTEATSTATISTEATTTEEISTEATTTEEISTEVATTAVTDKNYSLTLTVPQDDINNDCGITVECNDSKYKNLFVETPKDYYNPCKISDESIKEIFNIMICKSPENKITKLDEPVRVSIPYEKGLYIAHSIGDIVYDINAEYIDGKYVFETNRIGTFIIRTKPVGRTSPEKSTELKMENQTMVDELTGIQVSGNLPVGAEMTTSLMLIDNEVFYDRIDSPYNVEDDYPEFTDITDYLIELVDGEKKVENIAELISTKNWSEYEGCLGSKFVVSIDFVKDYEILDFDSDLTVTLPFDYRSGLITGGIKDEVKAVQYDYATKDFIELELVSAEATPKDSFQFKIKGSGTFFVGGESHLNKVIEMYKYH